MKKGKDHADDHHTGDPDFIQFYYCAADPGRHSICGVIPYNGHLYMCGGRKLSDAVEGGFANAFSCGMRLLSDAFNLHAGSAVQYVG